MEEKSFKKIDLKNGYTVEIFNASRQIGVDASYVKLILKMEVPVEEHLFKDDKYKDVNFNDIKDKLGDKVVFQITKERNLINLEDEDKVFKSLMDTFVETSLSYLSKKDFPPKFVLKRFKDKKF